MTDIIGWVYVAFTLALLLGVIFNSKFFKIDGLPKYWVCSTFLVKVISGFGLYFLYVFYYGDRSTSDALRFFDDAKLLYNAPWNEYFRVLLGMPGHKELPVVDAMNNWYRMHDHGTFNDNQTVIRVNAIVMLVSQGVYHMHTLVFNLLSFLGLIWLYRGVSKVVSWSPKLLWISVFFVPQLMFWGSGVLKEPLLLFGLGVFVYGLFSIVFKKNFTKTSLFIFLTGALLLVMVKSYVLIALIPAVLFLLLWRFFFKKNNMIWITGYIALLVVFGILIDDVFPGVSVAEKIALKQRDFFNVASMSDAGSAFAIPKLNGSFWQLVWYSPIGVFNSFFRPLPWNASGALQWFSVIENFSIVGLVGLGFAFRKKHISQEQSVLLTFSLLAVFTLYALAGLVTPVAGALVRYKIPVQPFLLISVLCVMDMERIKHFYSRMPKLGGLFLMLMALVTMSCVKTDNVALVVHNARIETLNDNNETAEAIAVDSSGVIVEVGPEHHIMNKYMADEYIDLRSRVVLPTFVLIDPPSNTDKNVSKELSLDLIEPSSADAGFLSYDSLRWQKMHREGIEAMAGGKALGLGFYPKDSITKKELRLMKTLQYQALFRNVTSESFLVQLNEVLESVNDRRWLVELTDSVALLNLSKTTLLPLVAIKKRSDWALMEYVFQANNMGFVKSAHPFSEAFISPEMNTPLHRKKTLKYFTRFPAYIAFTDTIEGSLEQGKLANFQVLSHNPVDVSYAQWSEISVINVFEHGVEK